MHCCNAEAIHSWKNCNVNRDVYVGICHLHPLSHCEAVMYLILTWWETCCYCWSCYNNFTVWWIRTDAVCSGLCSRGTHVRTHTHTLNQNPYKPLEQICTVTRESTVLIFVLSPIITSGRVVLWFLSLCHAASADHAACLMLRFLTWGFTYLYRF